MRRMHTEKEIKAGDGVLKKIKIVSDTEDPIINLPFVASSMQLAVIVDNATCISVASGSVVVGVGAINAIALGGSDPRQHSYIELSGIGTGKEIIVYCTPSLETPYVEI